MNLEQMRARVATILAQLEKLQGIENHSDEDVESINALSAEFDSLQAKIEAGEKLEAITAKASASTRKTSPATPAVEVQASRKEKLGGFNTAGEFIAAVRKAATGEVDKRFNNAMFEKNGMDDGGFLVPEEIGSDIQKKIASEESLLPKTKQFTVSGNSLSLPIDEKAPWNSGVQAYWTAEGAQITGSKPTLPGLASWRLNKLAAMVQTTDELLDDAVALESYIRAAAPEAIMHKINEAILSGNGIGKPKGLLSSGFKVKVLKEGAQAADTVVAANILKMYSKMLPASRAKAVWYMNAAVEEQLRFMKDDNGNYIYLAPGSQMNQSPYGILLGRPVVAMVGAMPALGDEGDIIFADLSYYYSVVKSAGVKSSMSTHLLFDKDQSAFKFTFRIDGSCPFSTPVTTQYGGYEMSAIITLEAR